jgi:hypothetical protein
MCESSLGARTRQVYAQRIEFLKTDESGSLLDRMLQNTCARKGLCENSPHTSGSCFWRLEKEGLNADPKQYGDCYWGANFKRYKQTRETTNLAWMVGRPHPELEVTQGDIDPNESTMKEKKSKKEKKGKKEKKNKPGKIL